MQPSLPAAETWLSQPLLVSPRFPGAGVDVTLNLPCRPGEAL